MAKPEQNLIWTILPNGISGTKLRFSLVVSPQFKNPTTTDLPLGDYPDFVDWPKTLKDKIRFELTFNDQPPIVEKAPGSKLKRLDPPFLSTLGLNAWKEIFATVGGARLRPIVRSYDAQRSDLPEMGIVTFSTAKTLDAVQKYYDKAIEEMERTSAPDPDRNFAHVSNHRPEKSTLSGVLREYLRREYGDSFNRSGINPGLASAISKRIDDIRRENANVSLTDPPPGVSDTVWQIGMANYYQNALLQKPQTGSAGDNGGDFAHARASGPFAPFPPKTIEFHRTVASLSSLPQLTRQLGLVIDFELEIQSAVIAPSGKVKITPKWQNTTDAVIRKDQSPWTAYEFRTNEFQAARKGAASDILNGFLPIGPPLVGEATYYLEQRDALAEALKLSSQIAAALSNEDEHVHITTPRASAIALLKKDFDLALRASMKSAQERLKTLQASSVADLVLFADDLVRGYRMDIKRRGVWRSLHARDGEYHFLNRDVTEELRPDEGWVAKSAARIGTEESLPDRLAVPDVICKWEGWSLVAPKPGAPLPSQNNNPGGQPPPAEKDQATYKVKFSATERSLPSLRFGEPYQVRVRLADLAGNSRLLNDPFGDNRDVVSRPLTFFRYDAIPSPDVVPRFDLSTVPGETAIILVIRSNYNTRCTQTSERFIAPPRTSELMAEMHGKFDSNFRVQESAHSTIKDHDKDGPATAPDSDYQVPYLSDPIASAAILRDLPGGSPLTGVEFTITNQWPRVKAWRLQVLEHPEAKVPADDFPPVFKPPVKDADDSILQVFLPKAVVTSFPLTSAITMTDLRLMGLWNQVNDTSPGGAPVDFTQNILDGKNQLFTPAKTLTIVHAVQQPLFEPRFSNDLTDISVPPAQRRALTDVECIKVQRDPNSTFATLTADMRMPGLSAATYKFTGTWSEPKDDGQSFRTVQVTAIAFGSTLDVADQKLPISGRHEFNDTKHREITYEVSAKTRFEKYLNVPAGASLSRESRRVKIHIPNTAVPPPPEIQYIIPTFGWEPVQVTQRNVTRKRRGGGLRVYLSHPWYETGSGELLGIRVAIGSDMPEEDELRVSRWARDPISSISGPAALLSESSFSGDILGREELTEQGKRVLVLGYAVRFDQERNLWFCDLEIDPGKTYFPFIRFALTRFQPQSLKNFSCSPLVVSDFCQLAPERTVSFERDLDSVPRRIKSLRVSGKALVPANEVTVTLERGRKNQVGEIRWEQAKDPVRLRFVNDASGGSWMLNEFVLRPDPTTDPQLDNALLRLVVKEYEKVVDDTVTTSDTATVDRLVYADTILVV